MHIHYVWEVFPCRGTIIPIPTPIHITIMSMIVICREARAPKAYVYSSFFFFVVAAASSPLSPRKKQAPASSARPTPTKGQARGPAFS